MAVIYAFIKGTLNNVHSKLFVRKKYSNHRRNRHYFSANGPFLLLPLALKWGLLSLLAMVIVPCLTARSASAASITFSIPSSLSLNVMPTAEGTFVESEPAKITISGADFGYNLSIKSQNETNVLKGTNGTLPSISTNYTSAQGQNGTWPVNTWGYKPDKLNGAANSSYLPGPTTGDVIEKLQTAISTNNEHTIQIAARVNDVLPAGAYSNTFVFTVTANKANYTINYDANGGTGDLKPQTGETETMDVKLSLEEPGSTTKAFEGWCTVQPNGANCPGERYYPGDTYKLKTGNDNITLYAIWDEPEIMQNWEGCTADLPINRQISLKDNRDGRLYYVARLADGNCWMTENLDFSIDEEQEYTPSDTDLQENWQPKESTYIIEDGQWSGKNFIPQSLDPGDVCWTGERTYSTNSYHSEDIRKCTEHDSSHYYLGNYYNYSAAVAQEDTSDHTRAGEVYNTSVCPAGWQLPLVNGNKSFKNLSDKIALDDKSPNWVAGYINERTDGQGENIKMSTVHAAPYYFPYVGNAANNFANISTGSYVNYETNEIVSDTYIHHVNIWSNGRILLNATAGQRSAGFFIRCVAR